jgi:hypothetical protein
MQDQLTQYYNDPNLQKYAGEAETAQTQAAAYQSASALLPQKLKDALNEKMDYNKDIIEQKNKAMSEYFQAPSQARAKYSDPSSEYHIWNPFQQEALVAQERAGAYGNYANLVDILGQRQGSLADIIQAGTGAFQADVMGKQGAADIKRQRYLDLLGEAQLKSDAAYKAASLAKGSGGGSGWEDILGLAQALGLIPGEVQAGGAGVTEEEPRYSPSSGVGTLSSGGQWIYTGQGVGGWEQSNFIPDDTSGESTYSSISDIEW